LVTNVGVNGFVEKMQGMFCVSVGFIQLHKLLGFVQTEQRIAGLRVRKRSKKKR
jgi:hypothetical protein